MEVFTHFSGRWGESEALKHLQAKGYTLLAQNWRYKHLEVDLILSLGNLLVMVEVKTRKSRDYGSPESFVSRAKQQYLIRAANHYLEQKQLDWPCRFDVVSVVYGEGDLAVEHIVDAFCPEIP